MRGCGFLLGMVLAACGGGSEPRPVEPPVEAPAPRPDARPPRWGLVRLRPCGAPGDALLMVTERRVYACQRAVFRRATGALLTAETPAPSFVELVAVGDVLLAQLIHDPAGSSWPPPPRPLVVVGEASIASEPIPWNERITAVAVGEGHKALVATEARAVAVDLVTTAMRDLGPRCAGAAALGLVEGELVCAFTPEEGGLRLSHVGGERTLPDAPHLLAVRWAGDRLVGETDEGIVVVALDGSIRRVPLEHVRLLDTRAGQALVTSSTGVAIVDLATLVLERLWPIEVRAGAFAGDELILQGSGAVLWLARGANHHPPSHEAPTPAGLVRLDEVPGVQWGDEARSLPWSYGDVAAFVSSEDAVDGEHAVEVLVSASEASELAAFDDDAAWARAAFHRFVPRGEDLWVRVWRDEAGRRVMRGHVWIGGCARTHYDVRVRELGDVLERYEAHTYQGSHARADEIFGRVPPSALRVLDDPGAYAGDPSTGDP